MIDRISDNARKHFYLPITLLVFGMLLTNFAWNAMRTLEWITLRPYVAFAGYFFIIMSFVFSIANTKRMFAFVKQGKKSMTIGFYF